MDYANKKNQVRLVINSPSKTGYLGFIVGMVTMQQLYAEYVDKERLDYLLCFKFSQDHLETLLSAIRGRSGWNNNPNCIQITAAYKRLLVHNEIKGSYNTNCTDDNSLPILSVSSTILKPITKKNNWFIKILLKRMIMMTSKSL